MADGGGCRVAGRAFVDGAVVLDLQPLSDPDQLAALLALTGDRAIMDRVAAMTSLGWDAPRLDAAALEVDPLTVPWELRSPLSDGEADALTRVMGGPTGGER